MLIPSKVISGAYAVLHNPDEKAQYDLEGANYVVGGVASANDLYGEEFGENAYETTSGDETGSDVDETGGSNKIKPNDAIKAIYKSATSFIQKTLADPQNQEVSQAELAQYQNKIREQNKRDGVKDDKLSQFEIDYLPYHSQGLLAKRHLQNFKKTPIVEKEREEAISFMVNAEAAIQKLNTKNGYPGSWSFTALAGGGWVKSIPKDAPVTENPSGTDPTDTGDSSGPPGTKKSRNWTPPSRSLVKCVPGYTLYGERILGLRPYTRTNKATQEDIVVGCQFLVEVDEVNPIKLMRGTEVGDEAEQAYLNLPEDEQNIMTRTQDIYTRKDRRAFVEVLGFASGSQKSEERYPPGYALVKFAEGYFFNGTEHVLSRSALRNVVGKDRADELLEEFFLERNLEPVWLCEPPSSKAKKRIRYQRKKENDESLFVQDRMQGIKLDRTPQAKPPIDNERIAQFELQMAEMTKMMAVMQPMMQSLMQQQHPVGQ